ncbi:MULTISPECIES: fimbrial protein [Lelliottia]|uniref:Fimbrial protein n=1 Tax=Lelliottia aquatilis TaxID=2080838 RepID=A0ABX5A5Y0_9ENTR|nr:MULTISPECIES: fimbrial protein [Lelliottia]MBL5882170.1 fimbrial protein [Lelliottia aquatilis]NTZ44961.1 fimbrial protein [Lelliottia aquatilis]POZ18674.1 fimbrial protein [Lelliottia aquatilis]POZ28797.1 fimbrial protein [Lelliottia aquatilis]POZ33549.1 fimbrial protein [Lelliottia aquatilis]
MRISKLLFLIILSCLFSKSSLAMTCTLVSYWNPVVSIGAMTVQRDAPVGTIIGTVTLTNSTRSVNCSDAGTMSRYRTLTYSGGVQSPLPNIYRTNLTGVGIQTDPSEAYFTNPAQLFQSTNSGAGIVFANHHTIIINVIKTGDIVSGTLAMGEIANEQFDNGSGGRITSESVTMSGGNSITVLACGLSTQTLTFPIGDVFASTFGSTPGTIPSGAQTTQNLGLNCATGANINVTLSGIQNPDVSDNSVLALTGQGSAGVAQGVGVQLLYNGSPLRINSRMVMKQSSGGQESLPLTARYYQTKTAVTTGSANTSATLNLTYQ